MLKFPLAKKTLSADGIHITNVEPAHWNMGQAPHLAESASHIGCKSVGTAAASPEVVEPNDRFKLKPYKGDVR
jgi:hypothetical protein